MAKQPLQESLEAIRIGSLESAADLTAKLESISAQQDAIRHELQRLREELTHLNEVQQHYQEQLDELHSQEVLRKEAETVFAALTSAYEEVRQRFEEIRTLQEKRASLLREYPNLEKDIQEFRQFEQAIGQIDNLPESYRQTMLEHHQAIKSRLEPYWVVQRAEEALWQQPLALPVILVPLVKESQFYWLLPVPSRQDLFPEPLSPFLQEFLEALLNTILRVSRHPDWFFADMENDPQAWQGYWAASTLMEYEGEEAITESAQRLLSAHLAELLAESKSVWLAPAHFEIEVAELSPEAWSWGQVESLTEKAALPVEEAVLPLIERSQGWYKDEDVVSWERPLKTTEGSNWNEQARRLRTLLINLIAEGKVGENPVNAELLWQPLPVTHARTMLEGINRLITQGVLTEVSTGHIAVNPAELVQVQNLINRDMNEFWQRITEPALGG